MKDTSTLVEAYKEWLRFAPSERNACCVFSHYRSVPVIHKDSNGHPYTTYYQRPLPDSQVCIRERAWRKYISLRDRKNYQIKD